MGVSEVFVSVDAALYFMVIQITRQKNGIKWADKENRDHCHHVGVYINTDILAVHSAQLFMSRESGIVFISLHTLMGHIST